MVNLSDQGFLFLLKNILSNSTAKANWPKLGREMVAVFLEDAPLSDHIFLDSGMEEQKHFPFLYYPEVCKMRGPPQGSWVIKWGSWLGLCQPSPWHCRATLQLIPPGLMKSLLPGPRPTLSCEGIHPWKKQLSPRADPGILQLSETYGLSHGSVNVLAYLSHRPRRTGHSKSAHLMVLAAGIKY